MHPMLSLLTLGPVLAAAAVSRDAFEFPDTVPMEKRQTSGPSYECHADCGFAIRNARTEGYCEDPEWLELLDGCLDCALEFDIWQHYGGSVGEAAEACGLDATPRPAGAEAESSSTPAPATTLETSSTSPTSAPVTSSEALPASTTSAAVVTTTSASTPGNGTITPAPTPPSEATSPRALSGILAVAAAAMIAAFVM
ncbi:hypothetical protein B0I35DRAFT_478802 [Stachybotrys elegans]|uniref:Uncharacterized protein n=1 Tax=Stachybotrys elegans TaxID=80388 RepID=A0A8K0SUI1_9HYPO|nr:hypothetical protein B0I35DRAFT_478802 [Stachybotrys elegans]